MIQANMKRCKHFIAERRKDNYGQYQYDYTLDDSIDVSITIFSQTIVNNPIYNDVTYIGITRESNINKHDLIDDYEVLYTIPSGRYTQILMKER